MAWNGSGIFNRLYSWVSDAANNINIIASRMDDEFANYKGGLENCLTRTGETTPTADLPMAGHRFTNVADGVNLNEFSSLGQVYSLAPVENLIPNSYFEVNQRSQTTYSTNGYTVDNLYFGLSGTTTGTLNVATAGNGFYTFDNKEPLKNYVFANITAGVGPGDFGVLFMDIPDLQKLSGQKVTVIFYAYSSVNGNKLSVEATQWFDQPNGGSAPVTGIGVTKYTLNTTGSRFVHTFTVPSIFGKTIGQRSVLRIYFWMDGGSNWDSRNGALGHQSGITTLYNIRAHLGDSERRVYRRTFEEELELCKSWYQKSYPYKVAPGSATAYVPMITGTVDNLFSFKYCSYSFSTDFVISPTVKYYTRTGAANTIEIVSLGASYFRTVAPATAFSSNMGVIDNLNIPDGITTLPTPFTYQTLFHWTAEVPFLT